MAGFFDGEGHISIRYVEKDNKHINFKRKVCIVNTDPMVLSMFKMSFGGTLSPRTYLLKHPKLQNAKLTYEWSLHSNQAVNFIMAIFPYLKLKRLQAELFMLYDIEAKQQPIRGNRKRDSNGKFLRDSQTSINNRKHIVDELKKLTKRGRNGKYYIKQI